MKTSKYSRFFILVIITAFCFLALGCPSDDSDGSVVQLTDGTEQVDDIETADGGDDIPVSEMLCQYDQDCNDDPSISALWGSCNEDGSCSCIEGMVINPDTGKCRSVSEMFCQYDQEVEPSSIPPGLYVFDVNPDLPGIRGEIEDDPSLKSYFSLGSDEWRALSVYVDQDHSNNDLPGNSAGLITFELLEESFNAWRQDNDRNPEEISANIIIQPAGYQMGYFTSPGGNYIHYIEGEKAGRCDSETGALEFFLGVLNFRTGEEAYDVMGDTQYAGTNILMPYEPLGTETYSNVVQHSVFSSDLDPHHTISGTRVSCNGKIFIFNGIASFAAGIQNDTNGDGTIDLNDDLIDANEDKTIDEQDIPDDLNLDGVIDGDDKVYSWKATLVAADNIRGQCVIAADCLAPYILVLDGLIYPAQD